MFHILCVCVKEQAIISANQIPVSNPIAQNCTTVNFVCQMFPDVVTLSKNLLSSNNHYFG